MAARAAGVAHWAVGTLLAASVVVGVGRAEDLTSQQEALVRATEEKLIAPCCFRQTLAEHRSELAETLRGEVRLMVARGATGQEMVDHFVAKYGERILATPRAGGFNLLAYVMPALSLGGGLVLLLLFVRRAAKGAATGSSARQAADSAAGDLDESLRTRMMEELDRFNA